MPQDPFDDTDVPDFGSDDTDTAGNQSFVQLRNYAKKLEKDLKAKDKSLESLESKLAELETASREASLKAAAEAKGISEEQLTQLLALKPDADVEALETFSKALGITAPPSDSEADASAGSPGDGEEKPSGGSFKPVSGSPVPPTPHTTDDMLAAIKRNDVAFLEKAAAEAAKDPSRLQLKHADLIE